MALVMDKVIEEILKYRKYKVWRCLDDNSLLALEKKDGDIATGRYPALSHRFTSTLTKEALACALPSLSRAA